MAVQITNEKELYQMLISEVRYSIKRDNHLAPSTCAELVMKYIPQMETRWQQHAAVQISEEIIAERIYSLPISKKEYYIYAASEYNQVTKNKDAQLEYDSVWESLLIFLLDYIDRVPYNWDMYDKYIKSHIVYSDCIEYQSQIIRDKMFKTISKTRDKKDY